MVESRLVPHEYGRIVALELEAPAARSLVRRGGEWFYREANELGPANSNAVAEEEVRRWFAGSSSLEVALMTAPQALPPTGDPPPAESPVGEGEDPPEEGPEPGPTPEVAFEFTPDWVLKVGADTGEDLTIRCMLAVGADQPRLCVRDEGPLLRLLSEPPPSLAFDALTFAPRKLTAVEPGEIAQLEILPPLDEDPLSQGVVRQSVHEDMGQWQLDTPVHVDDSGAIDLVRLENLLWAVQNLRAEAWVEPPSETPVRRFVAEVVPSRGRRYTLRLSLFPGCVVEVQGQRPAVVSEAQCAALAEDLMFDDPLRFWVERARAFEVQGQGLRTMVRRRDDQFVREEGGPIEEQALVEALAEWVDWRSQGIRAGTPEGKPKWRLDIRRDFGPPALVEVGEGWVRLEGADWYYLQRPPVEENAP